MLRLERYCKGLSLVSSLRSVFDWIINFLNYLIRISLSLASRYFSLKIISFFSSYNFLLAHSA